MKTKLIRIGEAAEILGVSIDTLRRWDNCGKLLSIRIDANGHRYYRFSDIEFMLNSMQNQRNFAKKWVESKQGFELPLEVYCKTRDVFQVRLESLKLKLSKIFPQNAVVSLVIAIVGEIGNNSFDHNLGNWSDIVGVFFHYDRKKQTIILADRGQGILTTLKRVRPELDNAKKALEVAFTEIISGRYPEVRGNGLKFVKSVVMNNPFSLWFQTENFCLHLKQNDQSFLIQQTDSIVRGCFATIKIEKK